MSVTVAVVTYQRLAKLQKMLPSLGSALAIQNLNIDVKIIFYINGADHQSVNFIRESNLSIQLIESSEILTPGAARNIILKSIETEWVCFFDDDIIVPEIFFKSAPCFFANAI